MLEKQALALAYLSNSTQNVMHGKYVIYNVDYMPRPTRYAIYY